MCCDTCYGTTMIVVTRMIVDNNLTVIWRYDFKYASFFSIYLKDFNDLKFRNENPKQMHKNCLNFFL